MAKQATETATLDIFARKGQAAPSVENQEAARGDSKPPAVKQAHLPFPREVEAQASEGTEPPPAGSLLSIDFRRLSDGERKQILSLKANKLPPMADGIGTAEGGQPLLPFPMEVHLGQPAGAKAGDPERTAPALPNWRNIKESRGKDSDSAEASASPAVTDHTGSGLSVPADSPAQEAPPAAAVAPAALAAAQPLSSASPNPANPPSSATLGPEAEAEPDVAAPPAAESQAGGTAAGDETPKPQPSVAAAALSNLEPKRPRLAMGAIAALALLAAIGLWALLPSDQPAQPEPVAATTPPAEPVAAPAGATGAPVAEAPKPVAPEPTDGAAPADSAALPESPDAEPSPSFDLIRVEPNGEAVLAGRAAPHASLIILDNDVPLGTVKADGAGEWAFIPEQPLPPGDHAFSLVVSTPQGEVVLPAREPAPAAPEKPAGQATDEAPAAPAARSEGGAPATDPEAPQAGDSADPEPPLPVAKPKQSSLPGIKHYGVQLSSTRSEQAARQEWKLLRERFPNLLGDKDLLIQKAVLKDGNTRFRVRAALASGPQAARKLCDALRAQNQDCLVFRE